MTHPCPATSLITSIYDHLGVSSEPSLDPKERLFSLQARAGEMVRFMAERDLTHNYISDLPAAIAMPILEMIRVAQIVPKKSWSIGMFELIGRTDLAAQAGSQIATSPQGAVQDVSNHSRGKARMLTNRMKALCLPLGALSTPWASRQPRSRQTLPQNPLCDLARTSESKKWNGSCRRPT